MTRTRSWHRLRARKATKARVERVGPVEVLEDEEDGLVLAQAREELEERLEQPRLGARWIGPEEGGILPGADGGQQAGQLGPDARAEVVEDVGAVAGQRAQRADERPVGQLALAELDRLAVQDVRAEGARAVLELGDEPALADARLPRHEGERRARGGGVSERSLELRHLAGAPDEPGAGHARRHGGSIARGDVGLGPWRRR